ncbi:MAG: hypothetical protein M1839_003294 [Geoglossum umbratile]|nr:MAG: hypothetical protein M1839_003294 [Geoglossum umbratile]
MSDNPKPKVGYQPQRDSDHATQLLADIEALRAYLGNKTTGRSKCLPRDLTDQLFNSMEGYIRKGIQHIQDILLNNTGSQVRSCTYAQAAGKQPTSNPSLSPLKAPGIPEEHELTVKLRDNNPDLLARRATNEQIIDRVNEALTDSSTDNPATKYV